METRLELDMLPQPDDSTCGPTCLHALYRFYGDERDLDELIRRIVPLETGGTLAVWLGCDALRHGYRATIYTYNLHMFDPTWFGDGVDLVAKLRAQSEAKDDAKLRSASEAYVEFLDLGGQVRFEELTPDLIRGFLENGRPVLTGLSATYLYRCARESGSDYDDVRGLPTGHFVVLYGFDAGSREVAVADPLHDNPRFASPYYRVSVDRLVAAILLGIVTYDANLLVIEPREDGS